MLNLLAQVNNVTVDGDSGALAAVFGGTFMLVWLAVVVVSIIGMWKVFEKAGKPGWVSIIPVYNYWVLAEIAGKPGWWALVFLLAWIPVLGPIAALVVAVLISIELAKAFGKDPAYAALLVLVPFVGFPMLGFGDAKYTAPTATAAPTPPATPAA